MVVARARVEIGDLPRGHGILASLPVRRRASLAPARLDIAS